MITRVSSHIRLFASVVFFCAFLIEGTAQIAFSDTSKVFPGKRNCCKSYSLRMHHFFEGGIIAQLGPQFVRTYNNFEHTTNNYNNNMVVQNARYITLRFGHEVLYKNIISAGITYGLDIYYIAHDTRAFVPLLLHVSKYVPVAKQVGFVFTQRMGGSFYARNKPDDPYLQYPPVSGGFTSETLASLEIHNKHKTGFRLTTGYRLQHLYTKTVFYPGTRASGTYPNLPNKITETSNALYNMIYATLGVAF